MMQGRFKLITIIALSLLFLHPSSANSTSPYFLTTIPSTFETGTAVLTTTSPTVSGSFASISTTISYLNTYASTPSFGYGFSYVYSNIASTTGNTQLIIDLSISSSSVASQTLLLNFTTNSVNLMSINYIACISSFFIDIRTYYQDLTATLAYTVTSSSRTVYISIPYKSKSNSSNSVVAYNTIGLSMIRSGSLTFQYQLSTTAFSTASFTVGITIDPNNGMRFLRFSIYDYESIVNTISSPYFLDMGEVTLLGGTITDSSGLGLTVTGNIFLGMMDWYLSAANSVISYNMSIYELTYSLAASTISRTNTAYLWYRQQTCPQYYYNSTNVCLGCDYSCNTCYGSLNTNCYTCPTTRSFSSSNNSCPCQTDYIDVGVQLCELLTCDSTCATCATINQCGSCSSVNFRQLSNGSCICIPYTIDMSDVGYINCFPCHVSCLTCSGPLSSTSCLTCNYTKDHRSFVSDSNKCTCIAGYYETALSTSYYSYTSTTSVCPPCQYTCATCTSTSKCLTCNSALGRTLNNTSGFCYCNSGTYDTLLSQTCATCSYSCSTCSSASTCLSCPSTRTLSSGSCPCISAYYDVGVATCQPCYYSCSTCSNSSQCLTCSASTYRTLSNSSCTCFPGYYDTYGFQICNLCDVTCLTCSGSGSGACLSCDSSKYRQIAVNNSCPCESGYYQSSPTVALCSSCFYSCASCTTYPSCSTCDGTKYRQLLNTSCVCLNGYFDDGADQLCLSCPYQCLTCTNSTICLSCDNSTRNTSNLATCPCLTGFYDTGTTSSCTSCLSTCLTCNNPTNCTSCISLRTLTSLGACACIARTFEPLCSSCDYTCLSCFTTSVTCTSCNGSAWRYLNSTTSQCVCYNGYYSDGVHELCLSCQYSCLTCSSASSCLTCPSNRVSNGTYCSCMPSLYQNSANLNCLSCHYSCQTCSSYSVCTSCNISYYRVSNTSISTLCVCSSGYYDNGVNQLCFACSSSCLTCSSFSNCLTCNSKLNRYYYSSTCLCNTGYYQDSSSLLCLACHYSCYSCNSATSCIICQTNRTIDPTSGLCLCNSGTYNQPVALTCQPCSYPCVTCTTSAAYCLSCDSTRTLSANQCLCLTRTYDTGTSCAACMATCQSCTSGISCSTCLTGSLRTLNNASLCVCPAGYQDQNGTTLNCSACQYSCSTCTNSSSCSSCYTGRIALVNGYCICPSQYYYDNGVNPQCITCLVSCLSCSNISTNCTSCLASNYRTLVNFTCQCNVGYYDNGVTALCPACQYSCLTCGNSTACMSCNSSLLRTYTSGPYCSCLSGYYDVGVALCSSCSYQCATCQSGMSACLTCPNSRYFVSTTSTCPCNPGYYDNLIPACVACSYQCVTCSNATSCLTCPNTTRILNSNMQCVCMNGYYDVNGSQLCQNCSPTCQLCSSYQICTLCNTATTFRQLVGTTCVCPAGYYDGSYNSIYICQICNYSCATCITLTQCTSCNSAYFRVYNISTYLCSCASQYYDDGIDAQCQICPYDCLTCSSATVCLTCNISRSMTVNNRCACLTSYYPNGDLCESCPLQCSTCSNSSYCLTCNGNRTLSAGACVCSIDFYAVTSSALCANCQYSCSTCVNALQCSTCNSSMYRYLTSTYCSCMTGYYDDLSDQLCQPCQYSCLQCNSSSSCLTCDSSINRVYSSATQLCSCVSGYYEDPNTKLCIMCQLSCLTCNTATTCTSCNPTFSRTLNTTDNECNCPAIGYFDTFVSAVCSTCDYTCYTCSGASTTCTSCLNTTYRSLVVNSATCVCQNGYFDVPSQTVCSTCYYACVTCSITSTNCTLCSLTDFRNNTPSCSCLSSYYDDGSNALCIACNYRCATCVNSLTCSSCNTTSDNRILNNITQMCDCASQYYDNGQQNCVACFYTCLTCNYPSTCLSCPSTRSLLSSACTCNPGYYDDGISLNCQACNYTCQTCTSAASCYSCDSTKMRIYNSTTLLCSCKVGYYDSGTNSPTCLKCDSSCYSCIAASSCTSCPPNINKTLNSSTGVNTCICLYGYFENVTGGIALGYNSICTPCNYACQTCSKISTNCTICNISSNRYLTASNQCLCNLTYFQIAGSQLCIQCYSNCLTCYGTASNNCLSCDNTSYYLNYTCYTNCPSYYVYSTSPTRTCLSCPTNCLSCPNSTSICTSCASPYFIFNYNSSTSGCINTCPSYYYQINSTCYACLSPCLLCSAQYACTSCIYRYYLSNATQNCYPCQASCLTCYGSTALDCLTCIPNYILKAGVCQKLSCSSSSQYVDSTLGCIDCDSTFANSLTCLSTGPLTCNSGYILSNQTCSACSQVTGYVLDTTTGKCKDYCGDGLIITDLCDDGNNLNGDGCSSVCTIEDSWICPNNVCQLACTPQISVASMMNYPKINQIIIQLDLNVSLRLITKNMVLSFQRISQFTYNLVALDITYTSYHLIINYYQTPANDQLQLQIKSPVSRLLQSTYTSSVPITINLNLSLTMIISTSPPAVYISSQQISAFSTALLAVVGILHSISILFVIIVFLLRLKVMLLVIDLFNSLTIIYILTALGFYNIGLIGYQATRGLQTFIYQFGTPLADQTTNFYYFNFTQNIFSSSAIQIAIILFCGFLELISPKLYKNDVEDQSYWTYLRISFIFAFSFDFMLSCFCIFFWTNYQSVQSSYGWTCALLLTILIIYNAANYYWQVKDAPLSNKVIPALSFITNDLQNRDKTKNEINTIFDYGDQDQMNKKQDKDQSIISQYQDEKTQGIDITNSQKQSEIIKLYDINPSIQTNFAIRTSNHISPLHLPIRSIIFAFIFSILVNIQSIVTRSVLLFLSSLFYFLFQVFNRTQALKSIRNIKLLILGISYLIICCIIMGSAINQQAITSISIDIAIISFAIIAILTNAIGFIINVYHSEAYRQYVINKKNQQIIERTRKQNMAHIKSYRKHEPVISPTKKVVYVGEVKENDFTGLEQPSDEMGRPLQIQVSQQNVEQKQLKFSHLNNRRQGDSRTLIHQKEPPSIINIDDQISDMKDEDRQENFIDEKQIYLHKSQSPQRNRRKISVQKLREGNRLRAMKNSEASLISKKQDVASLYFDNSLERIDEVKGLRRNIGKSNEKEEVSPTSKILKKKKKQVYRDVESSLEYPQYDGRPINKRISKMKNYEQPQMKKSKDLEQILDEFDMPRGFDKNELQRQRIPSVSPNRGLAIDEISSIKEQRQQFIQQGIGGQHSQGMNVFNKILQDYKVYKNKKIDKKLLRSYKEKKQKI